MLGSWWRKRIVKRNQQRKQRPAFRPKFESLETRAMFAANLFVATTGNDLAGNGTMDAPYATLAKALSVAQNGDSVVLRQGSYTGGVNVDDPNITIRSFDNEWATISAPTPITPTQNVETVIRFRSNASGGKLQRVEIIGGSFYGVKFDGNWSENASERECASGGLIEDSRIHDTGRDAIKITPGCDDIVIRRNEIYNSGRRDPSNAEGIDNVNGDRMIVQDNYIHDITTNGLYAKGGAIGTVIERNLIRNTGGAGITLGFRVTDAEWFDTAVNPSYYENIGGIVRNNIVVNTTYAGIALYAANDATVSNNTLVDVAQVGHAAVMIDTSETYITDDPIFVPSRDIKFANNIVKLSSTSSRPAFEIREGGLVGLLETAANRYFHAGATAAFRDRREGDEYNGNFAGWQTHIAGEAGSSEGDPRMDSHFHLVAGSPCIDSGASQFSVVHDYDGNSRSGLIDIGADEAFAGTPLAVPPPAGTIGTGAKPTLMPQVSFAVASSSGLESASSPRLLVTLSASSNQTVTVRYATRNGTAQTADFTAATNTITFAPGQTTAYVPLTVREDSLDENNEYLWVDLSSPVNAVLGSIQTHRYTINDNDATPQIQFGSTATGWLESTTNAMIPVKLSAVSGRPVTVAYRVVRGTATSGIDYRLANGTLTFQPGQVQKWIPVTIVNDVRDEDNENLVLSLSSPTNAVMGLQASHTMTIADNDAPPVVTFREATSTSAESAGTTYVVVGISPISGKTVQVNYSVVGGSATGGGVDFSGASGTLTFKPGESGKAIRLPISNDSLIESAETIRIQLSSPLNSTLGQITTHTVTIADDDQPASAALSAITYRLPNGRIYRVAPDAGASPVDMTTELNALSPGTQDDNLNISPDGRWMALTTDRFGIGSDWTGLAIVAADLSAGEAVRVNGEFVHPEGAVAVASGGNLVVYSASGGPHIRDLWAATKVNGTWTTRLLTANSPYAYNAQPAISADGTKVLFDAGNQPYGTGSEAIGEVRTDGTGFRLVITHAHRPAGSTAGGGIHHADYAPNGDVVFEAGWIGDRIWRLTPGASTAAPVSDANNEVSPCVLADGRIVTLWLNRPGNTEGLHELTVRKADGTYVFTLLPEIDVEDIGLGCGG